MKARYWQITRLIFEEFGIHVVLHLFCLMQDQHYQQGHFQDRRGSCRIRHALRLFGHSLEKTIFIDVCQNRIQQHFVFLEA